MYCRRMSDEYGPSGPPRTPKPEDFEFKTGQWEHYLGHVGSCGWFDQSACTCDAKEMIEELQSLRREVADQEKQIEALRIWFPEDARVEVARLRCFSAWQRKRITELVVRPVLED